MLKVMIEHDENFRPKDLRNLLKHLAKVRLVPKDTTKRGTKIKITLGPTV